jgi:hypothetical protein
VIVQGVQNVNVAKAKHFSAVQNNTTNVYNIISAGTLGCVVIILLAILVMQQHGTSTKPGK